MRSVNTRHPSTKHAARRRVARLSAAALTLGLVAAACSSDDDASDTTDATEESTVGTAATDTAPVDTATTDTADRHEGSTPTDTGAAGEPLLATVDPDRCALNQDAGTITYLSSFDFAAAASIVDVVVAEQSGYFDDMCLDVELLPSFSTANYPLVASDEAQFSSAGNYTEILNNTGEGAEFVAFVDYGKSPIEALITPEGGATELADLEGGTIGVKGDIPPSIVAMLAQAGLARGTGYSEVLLDGFDPQAHLATDIDALPVYKSNEPGQLDAAGVPYTLFDPTDEGIPGYVRAAVHVGRLLRRPPDRGRGLRTGLAEGHGGRDRRSRGRRGDVGRADRRRRQPELPHLRGRAVPLAGGTGRSAPGHAGGRAGRPDRSGVVRRRVRGLRRRRRVARRVRRRTRCRSTRRSPPACTTPTAR